MMSIISSKTAEPESSGEPAMPNGAARLRDTLVPKRNRSPQGPDELAASSEDFERHDTIPAPTWLEDGPES
jgi:hypothetical protein